MTMSDPIADMLTRIRNANTAKHDTVWAAPGPAPGRQRPPPVW